MAVGWASSMVPVIPLYGQGVVGTVADRDCILVHRNLLDCRRRRRQEPLWSMEVCLGRT